jgi:hypothetical protein
VKLSVLPSPEIDVWTSLTVRLLTATSGCSRNLTSNQGLTLKYDLHRELGMGVQNEVMVWEHNYVCPGSDKQLMIQKNRVCIETKDEMQ